MKFKNNHLSITLLLIVFIFPIFTLTKAHADHRPHAPNIFIENKAIRLEFDPSTGALIAFTDLTNSREFLDRKKAHPDSPWELDMEESAASKSLNIAAAETFRYSKPDPRTLILEWNNFPGIHNAAFKVKVTVRVKENKPLSTWNISLSGTEGVIFHRITFPNISGLLDMEHEELASPVWMGELTENPRARLAQLKGQSKNYTWSYPGSMSMQFLALYNAKTHGFYAACNDTDSYAKQFSFSLNSLNNLGYKMNNYPSLDSTRESYSLPYDAIIGSFKGDWISAAEMYKEWGTKQKWSRDSRFKNNTDSSWVEKTALWVWNRGKSNNVLSPSVALKKKLGLPVNVLWHWWHGCLYDDGFPEYFPPREGDASFKEAVAEAQNEGVKAIVYMNSFQWGTSTQSFEKENAIKWAVKNKEGNTAAHVFNIFTKHSLTPMCIATAFWKDKYAALADKAINEYHTGGVYMDQACLHYMCYDKDHGHEIGGGNYWVKHFGMLTHKIRSNDMVKNQTVLAGEGCGESWLPYLNAFLTLQVSKERYAGVSGSTTIPLFQAVYHQYGVTFGSYSSLVSPPYDELWPQEYAPKVQEQPLDPKFNEQFLMEQARSFVWGMQPTIANYHELLAVKRSKEINYLLNLAKTRYKGLKYLLYGEFMRPPHVIIPEKNIPISRLSIYAGQKERVTTFQKKVPLLYTTAWKANDGDLGIAMASISDTSLPINFSFLASDYGLPSSGKIFITDVKGKKLLQSYKNGRIKINYSLPTRGICIMEITR